MQKWQVEGKAAFFMDHPFMLCSVVDGSGAFIHDGAGYELKKAAILVSRRNRKF